MAMPPGQPVGPTATAPVPTQDQAADAQTPQQEASYWLSEIDNSDREYKNWKTRVRTIIKRYRDEDAGRGYNTNSTTLTRKFAILWSNVETLTPALYARTPEAVVQRRWKDRDTVGRTAAMVLERAANFSMDEYDFSGQMKNVVKDYLLGARGQMWVRYEPSIENTGEYDEVKGERACTDFINWDDFNHSISRTWAEVWWVSKTVYLTREECVKEFGDKVGNAITLDWSPKDSDANAPDLEKKKKARIYELWSKRHKQVIWLSRGYPSGVLKKSDPLVKFRDFFPCPRPVYCTLTTDTLIPVPDYVYYQDQAEELDDLTQRIGDLTDSLKLVGIYAGQQSDLMDKLLDPNTKSRMIACESWQVIRDGGGVKGLIDWFPVDQVIAVLQGCFETRQKIIEDVYQITGISDIVRGQTDPNETASAQQIKANWGGLRIRDRQQEIQRFVRDCLRLSSEVIAEQFSPETLAAMTGINLPTAEEKQQLQMQVRQQQMAAMMQAQSAQAPVGPAEAEGGGASPVAPSAPDQEPTGQPGPIQPPTPPEIPDEIKQRLEQPTWDEVMALLRNNQLRDFRIDVETDSTIQPDEDAEKQRRVEMLGAVGGFFKNSLEMLQAYPQLAPMFGELVMFTTRGFRVSAQVEQSIEDAMEDVLNSVKSPEPPPPDPAIAAAQIKAESDQKLAMLKAQSDQALAQTKAQSDLAASQVNAETTVRTSQIKAETDITVAQHKAAAQQQTDDNRDQLLHSRELRAQDLGHQQAMAKVQASAKPTVKIGGAEDVAGTVAAAHSQAMGDIGASLQGVSAQMVQQNTDALQASIAALMQAIQAPRQIDLTRGPDGKVAGAVSTPVVT